jgi:hypothetical protein
MRSKAKVPSPSTITATTPLRLDVAAQIAFPDESMGVSGLRNEIKKGNLPFERIAGKLYVTLDGIKQMREKCAVQKDRNSTCASRDAEAANADGSSSIPTPDRAKLAQAHLNQIAQRLKSSSTISPKSTNQTSAAVIPLKS